MNSPLSVIGFQHLGGKINEVGISDTAYPGRTGAYSVEILSIWDDEKEREPLVDWARKLYRELEPMIEGIYSNFVGSAEDMSNPSTLQKLYGANLQRLAELKAKYDPDNFFFGTGNIQPKTK